MASTYGARLDFRDATAAACVGLVHGSCWSGAEEPGTKHDLKGKGAAGEMARSGFSYGNCKKHATGCDSSLRTHLFVASTRSVAKESIWHHHLVKQLSICQTPVKRKTCSRLG